MKALFIINVFFILPTYSTEETIMCGNTDYVCTNLHKEFKLKIEKSGKIEHKLKKISDEMMDTLYDESIDDREKIVSLKGLLDEVYCILTSKKDEYDSEKRAHKQKIILHYVSHFFANCDDYVDIYKELEPIAEKFDNFFNIKK